MDTWIVHFFNVGGSPRVGQLEVQAYDAISACNAAITGGVMSNAIFSVRLKAPIVIPE